MGILEKLKLKFESAKVSELMLSPGVSGSLSKATVAGAPARVCIIHSAIDNNPFPRSHYQPFGLGRYPHSLNILSMCAIAHWDNGKVRVFVKREIPLPLNPDYLKIS